jgi:hypothetical protein
MTPVIDFNPFAYYADINANPEKYIRVSQIVRDVQDIRKIKHAATLQALNDAFQPPAKAAKKAGDTELLGWLTEAKDKRKLELKPPQDSSAQIAESLINHIERKP